MSNYRIIKQITGEGKISYLIQEKRLTFFRKKEYWVTLSDCHPDCPEPKEFSYQFQAENEIGKILSRQQPTVCTIVKEY